MKGNILMKDYYDQISKEIEKYESLKSCKQLVAWICDRIDWCWKFKKISEEQMNELCDRVIDILEGNNIYD